MATMNWFMLACLAISIYCLLDVAYSAMEIRWIQKRLKELREKR